MAIGYTPFMGGFAGINPSDQGLPPSIQTPTMRTAGATPMMGGVPQQSAFSTAGPSPTPWMSMMPHPAGLSQPSAPVGPYSPAMLGGPPMPMIVGQGMTPLQAQYGSVGTGQGSLLGSDHLTTLGQGIQGDVLHEQQLADQQHAMLGGVANQFAAGLTGAGQQERALGEASAGRLEGLGGEDRAFFEAKAAKDRAEFKDLTAQKAQAAMAGMRSQYQDQKTEIENGVNPDGSVMTPPQKQQALTMLNRQVMEATSNQIATIGGQYNDMARQAATMEMGQRVQSMGQRQQLQSMAEGMRTAALGAALNFEVQGLQGLAEMIRDNPATYVSRYAALAEMFKNNMTQFNANTAVNATARSVRNTNRGAGQNRGFQTGSFGTRFTT